MQQECNTDSTRPPSLSLPQLYSSSLAHLFTTCTSIAALLLHPLDILFFFFFFSIVPIPLLKIPFSPPLSLNQITVCGHFLIFISAFSFSSSSFNKMLFHLLYFVLSRVLFYLVKNRFCFFDATSYPGSIYVVDTCWYIFQYDDSLNKHLKWGMLKNNIAPLNTRMKCLGETELSTNETHWIWTHVGTLMGNHLSQKGRHKFMFYEPVLARKRQAVMYVCVLFTLPCRCSLQVFSAGVWREHRLTRYVNITLLINRLQMSH